MVPLKEEYGSDSNDKREKPRLSMNAKGQAGIAPERPSNARQTFMPSKKDPQKSAVDYKKFLNNEQQSDSDEMGSNDFDEKMDLKSYKQVKKPKLSNNSSDAGFASDEVDEKRSYTPQPRIMKGDFKNFD